MKNRVKSEIEKSILRHNSERKLFLKLFRKISLFNTLPMSPHRLSHDNFSLSYAIFSTFSIPQPTVGGGTGFAN